MKRAGCGNALGSFHRSSQYSRRLVGQPLCCFGFCQRLRLSLLSANPALQWANLHPQSVPTKSGKYHFWLGSFSPPPCVPAFQWLPFRFPCFPLKIPLHTFPVLSLCSRLYYLRSSFFLCSQTLFFFSLFTVLFLLFLLLVSWLFSFCFFFCVILIDKGTRKGCQEGVNIWYASCKGEDSYSPRWYSERDRRVDIQRNRASLVLTGSCRVSAPPSITVFSW